MLLNKTHSRKGFSLLEMGLAIVIISFVLVTAMTTVLDALNLQIEADRLSLAMSLAQTKMAELRNDQELKATDSSGEITDENDVFYGYSWMASIEEDKLNLTELLENTFGDIDLGDNLPSEVENQAKDTGGGKKSLFSLGDVPILRITVKIKYPKGKGIYGFYNIQTLQKPPAGAGYSNR